MHSQIFASKAKHLRSEANSQWSLLTPEDLLGFDGQREDLVRLLETRYGFAKLRAEREVDLFLHEFQDKVRKSS
jgi:hypothetical protein